MASVTENAIAARLLEAAVRLFAHKGYPATSTREIVEAAGVTKPMLYYYFQSKEGLLSAALGHFAEIFHERLRAVVNEPREPFEQLVQLVWTHLAFCQDHKPLARLFFVLSFGPDDQKNLVDLNEYTQVGHDLVMQVVQRAVSGGLVRDAGDFSVALEGMINIWIMTSLHEGTELTEPLARRIVTNLLEGYHVRDVSCGRQNS
jgi:AcrR family transcriptional regulator